MAGDGKMAYRLIRSIWSAVLIVLVLSLPAIAQNVPELNLSRSGLALRGVDPVSYFTAGKPIKGKKSVSVKHAGGTYRFASESNKKLFLSDPEKYLPAYGGHCSYGTAVGNKVDGSPYVWHIVDGKLYLNINRSIDRTWQRNVPGYIRQANKKWPGLKYK